MQATKTMSGENNEADTLKKKKKKRNKKKKLTDEGLNMKVV